MEENFEADIERRLVGRVPYEYNELKYATVLEADSGFGKAGAKLDPRTGAMMYDKYAESLVKREIVQPPADQGGVRFSKDSMAMIHITEAEDLSLSAEGELIKHSTTGVVSVKNLSDTDRIWDVFVRLRDKNDIAIVDFDTIKATELEPKNKVSKEYRIENHKPSIFLNENISTDPNYPESIILQKDQITHVTISLELKNISTIPYENVVLRKEIPQNLKDIKFIGENDEQISIEEGVLIWKLPVLLPDSLKVLNFKAEVSPEGSDGGSTGDVVIEAMGKETLTNFVITSFDAMCRNMYFVEADETEEPEKWLCNFVSENTSSFEVDLLKVDVRDSSNNNIFLNILKPGISILPKNRWESRPWVMEGRERPSFIKALILNVLPGLTKEISFKLKKEGSTFLQAGLTIAKSFDKRVAVSGRVTELMASIEIENVGSAALEQLLVHDILPEFMTPPTSFKVERGGKRLNDNVRIFVKPEGEGIDESQELSFLISDLSRYGGPLATGETIIITYTTQLVKPPPNKKIVAAAEVDGKPYLPGPEVSGAAKGELPIIETIQILRKFSIGKSIEQGTNAGEYNIGILYKNRGNQPIQNLVIKDILPKNFKGIEYTQEPDLEATPDEGTMLSWNIPTLKEGETTTILYKIIGEGEYHPTDAQVFYNTGAIKANVDGSDNILRKEDFVSPLERTESEPEPEPEPESAEYEDSDSSREEVQKRSLEDFKTEESDE